MKDIIVNREHPAGLKGEAAVQYEEICQMGYDHDCMNACEYILKEHPLHKK